MKLASLPLAVLPALLASVISGSALGQNTSSLAGNAVTAGDIPVSLAGDMIDNIFVPRTGNALSVASPLPPANLGSFDIVINAGAALAGNAAALAAFNRAALAWEARISDPITITINANLGSLGSGIIGSASSVVLQAAYTDVRNAMVSDGADELDDAITASLPTAGQFTATVPAGRTLDTTVLLASKANLKALGGFGDLDGTFGATDASITFSTSFSFDFDNSDGVGAGLMDFETVAAHEIGHALGFFSFVDSVNDGAPNVALLTLDMYRFANNTGADPATASDFTTFARNQVPGTDAIFDEISGFTPERRMATGLSNVAFPGTDGNQASHWKADEQTGSFIGLMDPTLSLGQFYGPQESDFRALDLIGYEIASTPVPEPSVLSALLIGGAMLAGRSRRARR
jgi:hypothetical protein